MLMTVGVRHVDLVSDHIALHQEEEYPHFRGRRHPVVGEGLEVDGDLSSGVGGREADLRLRLLGY